MDSCRKKLKERYMRKSFRKHFIEMVNDYEKRLDYARANTSLPDEPDYERINEFVMSVNERVVKEMI